MSADFAVVICTYDASRWDMLRAAVDSARAQTLAPREVIVVVDHNDSLRKRAERELDGVVVIDNKEDRGLRGARNSGLHAARASLIAFLDDDARATEGWLESLAEPYRGANVAGVGGATVPAWDGGRPAWFPPEFEWVVGCTYRGVSLERREVRNVWGGNMSFRRDILVATGGFRIGYSCDDTELCIRIRQRWPEKRFIFVPEARVVHYVERSRLTVRRFLSRCYFEGGSKAVLSRLVGADQGLASERRYTREVLPRGVHRSLRDFAVRGELAGLARAGLIVGGLTAAAAGYGVGQLAPTRAARKREWNGGALRKRRSDMRDYVPGATK
jgi:glycosyltransferase involved in cell wall biosynthesis